jgi:hypothetical protein
MRLTYNYQPTTHLKNPRDFTKKKKPRDNNIINEFSTAKNDSCKNNLSEINIDITQGGHFLRIH